MFMPPKYPRTFHWPDSETVHEDDSYSDFAHAFVGQEIIITEKLDGGNTLLCNGEVYARSTGQPSRDGWMAMVRKHHAWKTHQFPNLCFYGEDILGIHSIEYDAVHEDQTYYLFAVRAGDMFLAWDEVALYAELLGVPTVPVVFRGTFNMQTELTKFMQNERKKPSSLGSEREGFVIRHPAEFNVDKFEQHVVKYVRANHVQTTTHWRVNWRTCNIVGRK